MEQCLNKLKTKKAELLKVQPFFYKGDRETVENRGLEPLTY
ncbi:hypothetical protein TPHV1_190034 [Treponema phagedenis]|uniref:Uncharacterized protein n=1 Tax=Treponema phagedenis TaxID=162 RepID=A0A0B7GV24_TREPH|nr:hypothetical protein TPHV1_190034 [Treponema phagedenis]